jgi:putative transposase
MLSIRRQCELIELNRSTYYYQPAKETPLNLTLMRLIDEQYLKTPFYGYPKMTEYLRNQGYWVNPKRINRLMNLMGLHAVGHKRRTTKHDPDHKVYPYLLRNVSFTRTNQVWSADITYVPMSHGFMYLMAVLDWFSRFSASPRLRSKYPIRWIISSASRLWSKLSNMVNRKYSILTKEFSSHHAISQSIWNLLA